MIRAASLVAVFGLLAPSAMADGFRVRTAFGVGASWADSTSLDAGLGFGERQSVSGSARVMWDKRFGGFHVEVHSLLAFSQGDDVAFSNALAPFAPPVLPTTLFDMTSTWQADADTTLIHRIDRLSVSYTTEHLVLKAGRQAITWGSGLVFHPSDIVAPFAPNAIDTSYKPGVDMFYAQYLFDTGADIQAIAVPRPVVAGGAPELAASTIALRGQFQIGDLDASAMVAHDRGDMVASVSVSGALGGASWNAEYIGWRLESGAYHPSYLLNVTNFGTIGPVNISYFGEYFHNGFGVTPGTALDALPASLSKRMATGQVFLTGRDYLALGAMVQVSPDVSISPNAIFNLGDGSALIGVNVNYTLGDNTNLVFNYSQPIGADGSGFGGLETTSGSGIFVGPSKTASLQLVHFF